MINESTRSPSHRAGGSSRGVSWQLPRGVLRRRLIAALIGLDVIVSICSFWLAGLLGQVQPARWALIAVTVLPIYLLTAAYFRAYSSEILPHPWQAVTRSLHALAIAFATVILIAFLLKSSEQFSRLTLTLSALLSAMLLAAARVLFVARAARLLGGNPFDVVLICDADQPLPKGGDAATIIASPDYFDPDRHDPEAYDRLARALQSVDRVVVSCSQARRASWAHALKGAHVQGEILVAELERLAPLGLDEHRGQPTVIVANGQLGLADRALKRTFDIMVATAALLVLSPLLVAVAVAVRAESSGPVFFRQNRIGRGNAQFKLLKFRSMRHEEADGDGHRSTARDDDRITRVGAILRRTSLDELPQLLNVLSGHMSIVGPRPHAVGSRAADKLFWEIDSRYWHRHAAKPGLTGLAQVRGYRGATVEESDLTNRLQADLEYLSGWSLLKDIHIILKTFTVLWHRNAF